MINEIILEKLYLKENEFILVFDPDNLLGAEAIVEHVNQAGFSIVNYEDPEVFRYYYEENIRSFLDRGKPLDNKVLIRYTVEQSIPYDIRAKCFFVEVTLRELFPKLSYTVIKELYSEVFDKLYKVYSRYSGPILGDKGTKDFILKNAYGVIPEVIADFQELVKTFIPLYYRGEELPRLIADYAAEAISSNGQLKQYPVKTIVSGKVSCFHFIQEQWELYIRKTNGEAVETVIDFGNYEIRAYIDNLFQENYLTPVKQLKLREYPTWMQSGVVYDIAGNIERKFDNYIDKIINNVQSVKSYKDWFGIAALWAEVLTLKYDQSKSYSLDNKKFKDTGSLLKECFKDWLLANYNMLASLSYAKAPVMVHKIPWHINHRFPKQENKKVALLVIDGMSLDDWFVIKEAINENNKYIFEETLCFAWIPTMTSVSRQAIFSGEIPTNYADTLLSTNHDDKQWKKFWRNIGYNNNSVAFKRNIKEFREDGLDDILNDNGLRVLGLVVNMVDDIMHGQQLSIEGMHQDIRLWANKGSLVRFIDRLYSKDFEVFITSDHGNIGAVGQGTLQEGLAVESPGERVRFYNSDINCDTIMSKYKALKWEASGLPKKYNYVVSEENLAFVKEGKKIVAHGGLAIEEVIVPFIHMRKENQNA
ncbi:PglZ domain protein [Ruminiclostridium papyrosolvens DSM 2782]|uniref:PglZ domain protein n=1 Tax=Ruminiclostridium papyrosolvens DSM 2782 TaxID=588581 RepID=F1THD0_9FIRM|nr:BREX-3 system phosphatase PglZ [Ruminiclostridium papyrosolvens]EGD46133.1 PglZ domain protein [Ruminiclostridium papyrosolvens DSM 2782]WES35918.1 BREX-3 system phosphatase PglZ [Ruminiclostridium papyrosolvens DSM 2782]